MQMFQAYEQAATTLSEREGWIQMQSGLSQTVQHYSTEDTKQRADLAVFEAEKVKIETEIQNFCSEFSTTTILSTSGSQSPVSTTESITVTSTLSIESAE